jgi:hypothetical protein
MPRMGFGTDDQRSSSSFRFEEGRGLITDAVVARGTGDFGMNKAVIRVSIQRLGRDGKPTEDEPVIEDLNIGPLSKFHAGNAADANDEDPEDLGEEGEGNCIYAVEGAHPDPKGKASILGKSLQENGVRPQLLCGYMPHLVGIDADFARQMVRYEGLDKDASNLVIKKDGHIYNLADINKRVGGGATTASEKSKTKTSAPTPIATPKSTPPAGKTNGAAASGGDADDQAQKFATEILDELLKETGEKQDIERAKIASKAVTQLAKKKVPPMFHKPVQALIGKNDEWFQAYVEGRGFGFDEGVVTILAAE